MALWNLLTPWRCTICSRFPRVKYYGFLCVKSFLLPPPIQMSIDCFVSPSSFERLQTVSVQSGEAYGAHGLPAGEEE